MAEESKKGPKRPDRHVRSGEYGILRMKPEQIREEELNAANWIKEYRETWDMNDEEKNHEIVEVAANLLFDWGFHDLSDALLRYLNY